jgi:DtxR family Mn-dependent transcriptional regulator
MEDYLETILHLVAGKRVARVRDIAAGLMVHKSSVTGALRALAERKLIEYEPYGFVTLTEEGARLARDVAVRHEALRGFFVRVLRVDQDLAESAACRMEHALPPAILRRLTGLSAFLQEHPEALGPWTERLGRPSGDASASATG